MINSSQIRFNYSFAEHQYVYKMFAPMRNPEDCPGDFLKDMYLHWVDGVSQIDAFRCVQGFVRGSEVLYLRDKRIVTGLTRYRYNPITPDTPCVIFPFGEIPGKWKGFAARTPSGTFFYIDTNTSRDNLGYIFLRLGNSGRTEVYADWDKGLKASWETAGTRMNILLKV
jgi:hypothetical protein